ncbi:MAG: glutamine synthetase family protein [Pseudomonadota bacterium]
MAHDVDNPHPGTTLSREQVHSILKREEVRFFQLVFTDVMGTSKNVEVTPSQFSKALDGEILFDGSSIEGFVRIEESDMQLVPDLNTFRVLPWEDPLGRVARVICDVYRPDGRPFEGCPRLTLKRQIERCNALGYAMMAGIEAEFFLFEMADSIKPTTHTHDVAGYFDLAPLDRGESCRRAITTTLHSLGFEVEASHHEVAEGQHEIDFRYGEALAVADELVTFRYVVRKVARDHGLHATFLPKPVAGINGSGMHTHQSLFHQGGKNAFFDPAAPLQLSKVAMGYIAGLLAHAEGLTAICNPLVNSYKRLVPGYEAPTVIAWSEKNRSPLIRIPARRGAGTRAELRSPDPSCNPYLALTATLAAGLDGVTQGLVPPPPLLENVYELSDEERATRGIRALPPDLRAAVEALRGDPIIRDALGPHIYDYFVRNRLAEWQEYIAQVHPWEIERYLAKY